MKLAQAILVVLALPLAALAAPQWPTLEPYLPDKSGAVVVLQVDKEARETLSASLPFDPAIVGKVIDEHFGAFAKGAGIDVLKVSNVFGGLSLSDSKPFAGVVGFQLPLELDKVARTLKASARAEEVTQTPDHVLFKRGQVAWAFLKSGVVLVGRDDQLDEVLKRKGGAATNAEFLTQAKARGSEATQVFLMATLPPGMLPPLPEHPMVAQLGVDRQITTHLTGLTVTSNPGGLELHADFDDAAMSGKLVEFVQSIFKKWQDKAAAELAEAQKKAEAMGALGHFSPQIISARMGVEFAAYVSTTITTKADGKKVVVVVPREMLAQFKGTGTLATLGVVAAIAVPALRQAQAAGLQLPAPGR